MGPCCQIVHRLKLCCCPCPLQGRIVPCEFIGTIKSQQSVYLKGELVSNHDELMCNFFAQVSSQLLVVDSYSSPSQRLLLLLPGTFLMPLS